MTDTITMDDAIDTINVMVNTLNAIDAIDATKLANMQEVTDKLSDDVREMAETSKMNEMLDGTSETTNEMTAKMVAKTANASKTNEMIVTSNEMINKMTKMFDDPNKMINKTTDDTKNDDNHDKEDNGLDKVPNAIKSMIGADEALINKNEEMSDYSGHYDDTNDSGIDDEADDASMINPNATWINKLNLDDKMSPINEERMLSDAVASDKDWRSHHDTACIQNVMIDNCGTSTHQSGREAATSDHAKGDLDGDLIKIIMWQITLWCLQQLIYCRALCLMSLTMPRMVTKWKPRVDLMTMTLLLV